LNANIPLSNKPRVVIIGGGFGGLQLARSLSEKAFQIVLIDKNNFHQFQPLFYQVATAGLEPSSIAFPLRKVFSKKQGIHIRMAEVTSIEPDKNCIQTSIGEIQYDHLIIATGADSNYFGNKEIQENSLPMKSIQEALQLRNTLFQCFEETLLTTNDEERSMYLNFVVVGGGPTGVEVAGTLAEMKRFILPKDFPEIDFSSMRIILLEGSPRVLNAMSEVSSKKAKEYLTKMGVEVQCDTVVTSYDGSIATLKNGSSIATKTLIWAAGVKGNLIGGLSEESYLPSGRLVVDEYNRIINCSNIYAIGDVACMQNELYPKGHPQMAQPAIQQGKTLAKNLLLQQQEKDMNAFKYKDLGSMATVGRNKAVVELPNAKFQGFFAWILWLVVHLKSILGVRNKFLVLLNWIWNYVTYNLSLRLIIGPAKKKD
jgi:NADH dehydrogenase